VILLLDAHALLWWFDNAATLDPSARASIGDPANDVLISASTIWEIEIKRAAGRLRAPEGLVDAIESAGFRGLAVRGRDAEAAARLPLHHRDPFDRMLVAQAQRLAAVIVSRDRALEPYGVDILRA